MLKKEVVITGIGIISPIGNTIDTFWTSLLEDRSGVGFVESLDVFNTARPNGAEVSDFKPKEYFRSKKDVKQIKVMSRDIQLGFASAMLACSDAELITEGERRSVAPERLGVNFGADLMGIEIAEVLDAFRAGISGGKHDFSTWGKAAMEHIFPLWMLKYLPNMVGGHIAITHDARGPNNTLTLQRGSSLAAIIEGVRILERGAADVMFCGGCGNCINPSFLARSEVHQLAEYTDSPGDLPRPFDANRKGSVLGEGAATFILERRDFAEARGARIYAKIRGFSSRISPHVHQKDKEGTGIRQTIRSALQDANLQADEIGHLNADGLGTTLEDRTEAAAIRAELGDVPVLALKGYFGNLGSGTGAVELAASVLALQKELIPPTRNCDLIAEDCPIQVVQKTPLQSSSPFAMKINTGLGGRSFALIVEKP